MRRSSVAGLLYREFYLVRTDYLSGLITFLGWALLGFLVMLSLRFGNLEILLGDIPGKSIGIIKDAEAAAGVRSAVTLCMSYAPALMAGLIGISVSNSASKDTLTSWNRFVHCTPVTPLRFAGVKTAATVIATGVSFILGTLYLLIIRLAEGERFSLGDLSVITFTVTFVLAFSVAAQIFVILLRSRDMGYLCAVFLIIVPVVVIAMKNSGEDGADPEISELLGMLQGAFPYMLIVIAVLLPVLFVSMYLLYKRRER